MTQIGESVAVTLIKDPDVDHWAQLEYLYADGTPVQGFFSAKDGQGLVWTGTLNDRGQACLSGLPPGAVEFELLPGDDLQEELKDIHKQTKALLDGILAEERLEAAEHDKTLAQQSVFGRAFSHHQAVRRGFWQSALGLLTFTKDTVVKAAEVGVYLSPVTRMNNLLHASYTSHISGQLTWSEWRASLAKNYQEEEFKDLAELLGFDVRNINMQQVAGLMTEAYEIVAYIADDAQFRNLFIQFGKDYAGAQSSIEWAEFVGGGLFEIVLTALLLAFTGGLGNAAQVASKVRHAGKLRSLGGIFRRLGQLLRRKKLNKKTKAGVDSKKKLTAEKPEGKKLSSDPGVKKKAAVRTAAQDREEVSRLSRESMEAKKTGNTALAEAKLVEARNILSPHIPKAPDSDWSGFIERLDVQTPRDGAVFWSGGDEGKALAQRYAETIGGTTLEATPGGNAINRWNEVNDFPWDDKKGGGPPFSGDLWNGVSKKFANGAEGKVSVVQTPDKLWDQGTVWHNSEKGIIADKMMMGEVSKVEIFTSKSDKTLVQLSESYTNDLMNLQGIPR